jgi:CRISPR system Cascade subunit CasA
VKACWFSKDARGDFGFVEATFWSVTEPHFYRLLEERIHAAQAAVVVDRTETSQHWCEYLYAAIQNLFDKEFIGAGDIERENPARIAQAKRRLLACKPKLRAALGLSAVEPTGKTVAPKRAAK